MRNPALLCLLTAIFVPGVIAACSSDGDTPAPKPDASAGGKSNTGGKATGGSQSIPNESGTPDTGAGGTTDDAGSGGKVSTGGRITVPPDASSGGSAGTGGEPADSGADGGGCVPPRCQPAYPEVLYPAENPQSDAKAMLGKVLFWEQQIGQLGTMACGSCHRSNTGGSLPIAQQKLLPGPNGTIENPETQLSDDIRGALGVPTCDATGTITNAERQATTRKPPTYFDAMFAGQIFWDGRAGFCKNGEATGGCFYDPDLASGAAPIIKGVTPTGTKFVIGGALEAQASGPPANSTEMACGGQTPTASWARIATKLKTANPLGGPSIAGIPQDMRQFITEHGSSYPNMFKAAFGTDAKIRPQDPDEVINTRRIVFAIATHERRLTSNQTPYDRWNAGDDSAMTEAQVRGFTTFVGKARCSFCHAPPLFTDNSFHNIGFHKPQWDIGRKAITGVTTDNGSFRTATLRNVKLREAQGLLHSGAGPGKDLNIIMTLYKQGGMLNDPEIAPFIDPGLLPLPTLNAAEIADVIDFMRNALTDPRVERQCPPFDRPCLDGEACNSGPCP